MPFISQHISVYRLEKYSDINAFKVAVHFPIYSLGKFTFNVRKNVECGSYPTISGITNIIYTSLKSSRELTDKCHEETDCDVCNVNQNKEVSVDCFVRLAEEVT